MCSFDTNGTPYTETYFVLKKIHSGNAKEVKTDFFAFRLGLKWVSGISVKPSSESCSHSEIVVVGIIVMCSFSGYHQSIRC